MEGKLVFVSSYFIGTAAFINLYFKKKCNFRLYTILSHVFTYKPFLKSSEDTNSIQYTVYIQYTSSIHYTVHSVHTVYTMFPELQENVQTKLFA